jgi:hypothetical protein
MFSKPWPLIGLTTSHSLLKERTFFLEKLQQALGKRTAKLKEQAQVWESSVNHSASRLAGARPGFLKKGSRRFRGVRL